MTMPGDPPNGLRSEPWSEKYTLVRGVDIVTWPHAVAAMTPVLYERLADHMGGRVIGQVGGLHYEFATQRAIPSETIAVPKGDHPAREPDTLLLLK